MIQPAAICLDLTMRENAVFFLGDINEKMFGQIGNKWVTNTLWGYQERESSPLESGQ